MTTNHRQPGVISAAEMYTLREFRARLGWGHRAWRQWRDRVPVTRLGRKLYVSGKRWLEVFDRLAADQSESGSDGGETDA